METLKLCFKGMPVAMTLLTLDILAIMTIMTVSVVGNLVGRPVIWSLPEWATIAYYGSFMVALLLILVQPVGVHHRRR